VSTWQRGSSSFIRTVRRTDGRTVGQDQIDYRHQSRIYTLHIVENASLLTYFSTNLLYPLSLRVTCIIMGVRAWQKVFWHFNRNLHFFRSQKLKNFKNWGGLWALEWAWQHRSENLPCLYVSKISSLNLNHLAFIVSYISTFIRTGRRTDVRYGRFVVVRVGVLNIWTLIVPDISTFSCKVLLPGDHVK